MPSRDLDKLKAALDKLGSDWEAKDFLDSWNLEAGGRLALVLNAAPGLIDELERLRRELASAKNLGAPLLEALKYMEQNLVKYYSGHCIHCGGVTQCKPSCPIFHMKAAIQAAREMK